MEECGGLDVHMCVGGCVHVMSQEVARGCLQLSLLGTAVQVQSEPPSPQPKPQLSLWRSAWGRFPPTHVHGSLHHAPAYGTTPAPDSMHSLPVWLPSTYWHNEQAPVGGQVGRRQPDTEALHTGTKATWLELPSHLADHVGPGPYPTWLPPFPCTTCCLEQSSRRRSC